MEKSSAFVQEIITECNINAPADKVYSVISDFAHFDLFTKDLVIQGEAKPGSKLRVMVHNPDGGWMKLSSRLIGMDKSEIVFRHVLAAPFLFRCIHRYEIIPLLENRTRFINSEIFSGVAVPFTRKRKLLINARKFKDEFNAAFKQAVEGN